MIPRRFFVLLGLVSVFIMGASSFATTMADTAPANTHQAEDSIAALAAEYLQARAFPGDSVPAGAYAAARQSADAMSATGGSWVEQTRQPYNAEPAGYTDPFWSNIGAGWSLVGGRVTALASSEGTLYAGGADGGVWKLDEGDSTWRPLTDKLPSLSIGALAVNPADHSVWVGTGEANTNADSYQGTGVYRMTEDEGFQQVGGNALLSRNVYQVLFDGAGSVYAATNRGLFKTSATGAGTWASVLMPGPDTNPPYNNHITTVAVRPGTHGQEVAAVVGWRNGRSFNGVYKSLDGGATFTKLSPPFAQADMGRATWAYAADGRLYMVMESPRRLGTRSALLGVYVSKTGDAGGPWVQIADGTKLENSGSALTPTLQPGYNVGVQAWYNQVLAVDPANSDRLYVGLEEIFQTNDGGKSWQTASPYWNYGLKCNPNCPRTTHPDQHGLTVMGGRIVIGNDGGVFSRPLSVNGYGSWLNLNATLHNLQYYDAGAGKLHGRTAFWGGLQDNGTSLLIGGAAQMVEPAGGDGFDVIVDPNNADRSVGEYTNLTTYLTTDGGHSFINASPSCVGQQTVFGGGVFRADCDPNARFWAPFAADKMNTNHWIAAGEFVWNTVKGWDTRCDPRPAHGDCDWKPVYDMGPNAAGTAVTQSGDTQYVAWVDQTCANPCGLPGGAIPVGIATNFGGTWHQLNMSTLPMRLIAGVTVDTEDPAHVFAAFNGYSRRWIPRAGNGTVFESKDGGATWTDLTGNLPDAPGNALVKVGSHLVLATDVGVFTASTSHPNQWSKLGNNLPNVSVNNVTLGPDGKMVVAGTHGRGIWTFTFEDSGGD